jgi:hypothetical protein
MAGTQANDSMAVQRVSSNNTVWLNDRAPTIFSSFQILNVQGRFGDDKISLYPLSLSGVTTINVDGGDPTASDEVVVNGTSGSNTFVYSPTAFDAASVTTNGVTTNITATEAVVIDGLGGDDRLTVTTPTGAQNIAYTPGATVDAASVRVNSLLPMRFVNLGTAGNVTLADSSGNRVDALVYDGTAANDTFTVAGASGAVTLNSQIVVNTPGVSKLALNGSAGNDAFNVGSPNPYTDGVTLAGGEASPNSDVANITTTSSADAVSVDLASQTVSGLGGVITLAGTEVLNLISGGGTDSDSYVLLNLGVATGITAVNLAGNSAASDTLTVVGTANDDTLEYTPTAANAGQISDDDANTLVTFSAVQGTFTVEGNGSDADELEVLGTNRRDQISIVAGPTRTVQVNSTKAVDVATSLEIVRVLGRDGDDTFTVTPALGVDLGSGPSLDNLYIEIDGGNPQASDALIIDAPAANQFVVLSHGRVANTGVVRVFQDAVAMPDITFQDVEVVQPNVFGADGDPDTTEPHLMILGADTNEPNETRANSAYAGSGQVVQVLHA